MQVYGETITFETVRSILKIDFKDKGDDMYHLFLSYGRIVYENDNGFRIAIELDCARVAATLTSTFVG